MAQSIFKAPSGPHKPAPVKGFTIRGTGHGGWQYVGGKGAKAPKVPSRPNPAARAAKSNVAGRFGSALFDPSQQLTGKNLSDAATSIADAQTKGPISELAKQIAANNQQSAGVQKQDFGYYMSLAQAARQAVGQSQQAATGLNTTLTGIGQDAQNQLAQIGQQAQGGVVGRMNALGLGGDSTAQIAANQAQQQGLATQNAQTFRQQGAIQGAADVANASTQASTTGMRGQDAISGVAQKNALANEPLNAKIAGLQASKGALTATALGQLRTAERNYQVAQEGLGIKQQGIAATAANNRAKNALTARAEDITAQNNAAKITIAQENVNLRKYGLRLTSARDVANEALRSASIKVTQQNNLARQGLSRDQLGSLNEYRQGELALRAAANNLNHGGGKPLTTSQNNAMNTEIGRITNLIQTLQKKGIYDKQTKTYKKASEGDIRNLLGQAYNPTLVDVGYQLLGYGSVNRTTAALLNRMGVRGTTFRGAPVKVTRDFQVSPGGRNSPH